MNNKQTPLSETIDMYWWNKGNNFGDVMNPLLFEALTGKSVQWCNAADKSVFTAAGSLIDTFHTKDRWTIWGAGVISKESGIPKNLNVLAVRGPKTRQHLLDCGYSNIPKVYGDPGLLLPLCFPVHNNEPEYDIGIVPHYAFRLNPAMHAFKLGKNLSAPFSKSKIKRVKVISPKIPVHDFLAQINNCKVIVANSLHGLIVAMAYGKPCVWIHFEKDPFEGRVTSPFVGDTFKYLDFLQSVGSNIKNPIIISKVSDWKKAIKAIEEAKPCQFDPEPLLNSFPYKTENWDDFTNKAKDYFKGLTQVK